MAFPTILVDSATGSDSAASGAGPSTALTGTAASTSSDGLTVTLDSGTVLTGVSTTGSDAIYLADATAGNRNFGKITATSGSGGSTPAVTVAAAFGASLTGKSWAIGGKRASVGSTSSYKLFDNNSASGDLMPGWAVELQSAHSETVAAPLIFRRDGDTTSGPITLRGASGAATLPLLTFSNNGRALDLSTASGIKHTVVRDFELRNSSGTKTAATAIDVGGVNYDNRTIVLGMKVSHATNYFNRGVITGEKGAVVGCEFGYCSTTGIDANANAFAVAHGVVFAGNRCHHCGSHGINVNTSGGGPGGAITSNRCWANGGDGIHVIAAAGVLVAHNTCHGNTGSGLYLDLLTSATTRNNCLTGNGAYGVNFNGASAAAALTMALVDHNCTGSGSAVNTSGAYSTAGVATNDLAADPTYADATNGDFTPGNSALQAGVL